MADANITISANTRNAEAAFARLDRRLGRIERSTKRAERSSIAMNKSLSNIARTAGQVSTALTAAATAFAGFAVARVVRGVIDATKQFELFRAQLTTFLGSQQLANTELQRLESLATGLPQNVNDLTAAFVVLTRNGLDTSNESMKAFANIASATGKSVEQFALAIEDAMRGEFERIKEFGIKVSQEGDKYVARFGDQIVATETSASRLSAALVNLGKEGGKYFGAAERQANDLTTGLSNLDAAVTQAQRAIGEAGLAQAINAAAREITAWIEANPQLIQQVGVGFTKAFLYAKEAALLLARNIDIVGYTLAAVFGAAILRGVLGFASMIAGPVVGAFVVLSKVLKASALIALRHPLIGLAAVVVGGIEYLTGAVSGLAEKLGLIGDDSALEGLIDDATNLGNEIKDGIGGGLTYVSTLQERVNAQAEEYRQKAAEVNQTLDETAANLERQRLAEEARNGLADSQRELLEQILTEKQAEYELALKTNEQQEYSKLLKEIEVKLNRELTDTEKERLQTLIQNNAVAKSMQDLAKQHQEVVAESLRLNIQDLNLREEQAAVDELRLRLNRELSEEEERQVRAIERIRQANKETLAIEQARNQLAGKMTKLEAIQRGVGVRQRLDPNGSLATEYKMDREALLAHLDEKMASQEEYQAALYRLEQEYADKRNQLYIQQVQDEKQQRQTQIQAQQMQMGKTAEQAATYADFMMKTEAEKAQFAISQGAMMFNELGKYNKDAFEAAKAFNIAQAIMNTYMGATKALASYPPPFNFIAAAAVVASGLAQVAQIRSQTYSGRALGGPVMGGKSYIVGESGPELFTPSQTGSITRNGDLGKGGETNINFTIVANDSQGFDDLLIQRQGMIKQMISDAMIERGQRSMV